MTPNLQPTKGNPGIEGNIWSTGNFPATFWQFHYGVTETCLCDWQPPTQATVNKHDWKIVVGPLVLLDCTAWMLMCSKYAYNYIFSVRIISLLLITRQVQNLEVFQYSPQFRKVPPSDAQSEAQAPPTCMR